MEMAIEMEMMEMERYRYTNFKNTQHSTLCSSRILSYNKCRKHRKEHRVLEKIFSGKKVWIREGPLAKTCIVLYFSRKIIGRK